MRIYIFKSETRKDLRAFAGDLMGSKLPMNHGPWSVTGTVGPEIVGARAARHVVADARLTQDVSRL